jgi:hypothetical protein
VSWTIGNNIVDLLEIEAAQTSDLDDNSGILKMEDGTLIKVYPTLTTGPVNIIVRTVETTQLKAEFLDLSGSLLKSFQINKNEVELDLSNFKSGVYLIKLVNNYSDQKLVKIVKI